MQAIITKVVTLSAIEYKMRYEDGFLKFIPGTGSLETGSPMHHMVCGTICDRHVEVNVALLTDVYFSRTYIGYTLEYVCQKRRTHSTPAMKVKAKCELKLVASFSIVAELIYC